MHDSPVTNDSLEAIIREQPKPFKVIAVILWCGVLLSSFELLLMVYQVFMNWQVIHKAISHAGAYVGVSIAMNMAILFLKVFIVYKFHQLRLWAITLVQVLNELSLCLVVVLVAFNAVRALQGDTFFSYFFSPMNKQLSPFLIMFVINSVIFLLYRWGPCLEWLSRYRAFMRAHKSS